MTGAQVLAGAAAGVCALSLASKASICCTGFGAASGSGLTVASSTRRPLRA